MSTTAVPNPDATRPASVGQVAMKLEVVTIPVSDVDRAKAFYQRLGWRLDGAVRRELAGLVRRVHGARAVGRDTAGLSETDGP
jgi:catechol 2,3-dioxygenase-like lactoylglutathione lyase family enzyme